MKVQYSNLNLNNDNYYNKKMNNNISFKAGYATEAGIFLRRTIMQPNQDKLWHDCSSMSHTSGLSTKTLISVLYDATKKQFKFMDNLVNAYHARNWFPLVKKEQMENPKFILEAFKAVEKPSDMHFKIITNSKMPLEMLADLYKAAPDEKSLSFVNRMQTEVLDGSAESAKKIISILDTPYREEIIKDFDTYKSFFMLHKDSGEIAKMLTRLLDENKFNKNLYDSKYDIDKLVKSNLQPEFLNKYKSVLEENYSPERCRFIDMMADKFLSFRKILSESDYKDVLSMYKSTTPENIALRSELMTKFREAYSYGEVSDVKALRQLYEAMDSDKNVKEFVSKALASNIKADTIQSLLKAVESVPPKKLNAFHKNVLRIYANSNSVEELQNGLLKEVENPFYTTPYTEYRRQDLIKAGFEKEQSKFQQFLLSLENKYNQLKYKYATRNSEDRLINLNVEYEPAVKDVADKSSVADIQSDYTRYMPKVSQNVQSDISKPVMLVRTIKESPQARKLRVTSDINGIIERKLGEKTLEKQKGQYAESATVMRLKLLNDIFDSIAVTRKQQRANGLRPNIENRDAIKVFNRINGKNKKLVRYMLRQTNGNNERIYNLKDIIAIVDNAEAQIAKNKKADKSFKAADAKAYYENIYQSLVQEHGKLKRKRKI